jgi:RNA polymerase sigma factor (TIGR02999 family)
MKPQSHRDHERLNDLVKELYGDLHRVASRYLKSERSDHTLQATALLHEVYLKLSDDQQRRFSDRSHFMAVASRVMRQVLVDHARARGTKKRGSGLVKGVPDVEDPPGLQVAANRGLEPVEILELNRALDALAGEDEALAQIIEMRYFGGMTATEIAEYVGRSVHVVRHDLRLAQAWLRRELSRRQG